MKRFWKFGFVAAAAAFVALWLLVFRAAQTPVHAADNGAQAAAPGKSADPEAAGAVTYAKNCAICHGDQREGILPGFPPLASIKRQMTDVQIIALVHDGKGRMPGFPKLKDEPLAGLLRFLGTAPVLTPLTGGVGGNHPIPGLTGDAAIGGALFQQNCAFCHGRDAMGGETGPDLTQSKVVLEDKDGSKISAVVHEGRNEEGKKMPAFQFSSQETTTLVAFIRARVAEAATMKGGRRGVEVADLQTGNAEAGKKYFNGAGGCSQCHSPTGDLAGIARRFEGLRLEERMLYPGDRTDTVAVTLPSGEKFEGRLAYRDEFTIGLRDKDGVYRSWPTETVKYVVNSPVQAHVDQFPKYTDNDVHNLMAFLQTLK